MLLAGMYQMDSQIIQIHIAQKGEFADRRKFTWIVSKVSEVALAQVGENCILHFWIRGAFVTSIRAAIQRHLHGLGTV